MPFYEVQLVGHSTRRIDYMATVVLEAPSKSAAASVARRLATLGVVEWEEEDSLDETDPVDEAPTPAVIDDDKVARLEAPNVVQVALARAHQVLLSEYRPRKSKRGEP